MKRRHFFGLAAATVATPVAAMGTKVFKEDKSAFEPKRDTLHLTTNNTNSPKQPDNEFVFRSSFDNEHANTTVVSVGSDNRLWTKVDNQWYRIALEKE